MTHKHTDTNKYKHRNLYTYIDTYKKAYNNEQYTLKQILTKQTRMYLYVDANNTNKS